MIYTKIKYHLKYVLKEFFYIFKFSFIRKEFFMISLSLSIKFLLDAGIKNLISKREYSIERKKYEEIKKRNLNYNNDWFSNNITTWVKIFNKEKIEHYNLNILEIGSYEGLSAVFFLNYFKNCKLTCVETFEGSDEHSKINFKKVEENFSHNLEPYKDRFYLAKGTSNLFFENKNKINSELFDIIYIDGSHHYDDVLSDAQNSYNHIKQGGIIIFDDFLKRYYKKKDHDPITAILKFIKKNKNDIDVMNVNYQIIIKKNNKL